MFRKREDFFCSVSSHSQTELFYWNMVSFYHMSTNENITKKRCKMTDFLFKIYRFILEHKNSVGSSLTSRCFQRDQFESKLILFFVLMIKSGFHILFTSCVIDGKVVFFIWILHKYISTAMI